MFHCPHCGEPLDDDARSCPHCGSDEETGWNPDVDYYSVELPEDGAEDGESVAGRRRARPAGNAGPILLATSLVVFLAAGAVSRSWNVLLPFFFLTTCALVYALGTRRAGG